MARAPTFVLWARDDQPHEVKVRLSVASGIQLLESSTICDGSDICSLTVTDIPIFSQGQALWSSSTDICHTFINNGELTFLHFACSRRLRPYTDIT